MTRSAPLPGYRPSRHLLPLIDVQPVDLSDVSSFPEINAAIDYARRKRTANDV